MKALQARCWKMNGIANLKVTSASCECAESLPVRICNECVTQRLAIPNMTHHLEFQEPEPDVRNPASVRMSMMHTQWQHSVRSVSTILVFVFVSFPTHHKITTGCDARPTDL